MNLIEVAQTMSALGAIGMILIGTSWLKVYMKSRLR